MPQPSCRLALCAVALATLTGCPDLADWAGPTPPGGGAAAFTKLSEHGAAAWAAIALGADGTRHVLFQDTPRGGAGSVYHRASTDGGATWSAPELLSARGESAGVPRLAVDGQGRVYAAWKVMKDGSGDSLSGGPYGRELVYRVLEGGAWSPAVPVSASRQTVSWFLSADPTGKVHAVWTEHVEAPNGYQTISPAVIRQATLAGPAPGAPKVLVNAAPDEPADYDGSAWHYPSYSTLRGYVDAQGKARFVSVRTPSSGEPDEAKVVYWDGDREVPLFAFAPYGVDYRAYYNPPELLVDAGGAGHVLVQDVKGERQGVLDFPLEPGGSPRVVRAASEPTGELKAFQVVQGPAGRMAALLSLKERSGAAFELFAAQAEGGAWGPAANLTDNAARGEYKDFQGDAQVSISHEPAFAAGVFGPDGLELALVNQEKGSVTLHDSGVYDGRLVDVQQGGVTVTPYVFFLKL